MLSIPSGMHSFIGTHLQQSLWQKQALINPKHLQVTVCTISDRGWTATPAQKPHLPGTNFPKIPKGWVDLESLSTGITAARQQCLHTSLRSTEKGLKQSWGEEGEKKKKRHHFTPYTCISLAFETKDTPAGYTIIKLLSKKLSQTHLPSILKPEYSLQLQGWICMTLWPGRSWKKGWRCFVNTLQWKQGELFPL